MTVPGTIIDEGSLVSILSSTSWQALGSPPLMLVTQNLLAFNRGTNQPLGILPHLPITLGGKIVYLNMMVIYFLGATMFMTWELFFRHPFE